MLYHCGNHIRTVIKAFDAIGVDNQIEIDRIVQTGIKNVPYKFAAGSHAMIILVGSGRQAHVMSRHNTLDALFL